MGCDLTDDNAPVINIFTLSCFLEVVERMLLFLQWQEVGKRSFFPFWMLGACFSGVICFHERDYCLLNTRVVAVNVWRVKGLKGRDQKTFRVLSLQ